MVHRSADACPRVSVDSVTVILVLGILAVLPILQYVVFLSLPRVSAFMKRPLARLIVKIHIDGVGALVLLKCLLVRSHEKLLAELAGLLLAELTGLPVHFRRH